MDLQTFLTDILAFANNVLVPFLLAVAFLIFIWNAARYFIIGGANEDDREKARSLATWSIAAFVIMVSLWGIVNTLVDGFNWTDTSDLPDYIKSKQ